MGPMLMDLAALTAGRWTEDERAELATSYRTVASEEPGTSLSHDDFMRALDCCRLQLAVQRFGWARQWTPPATHTTGLARRGASRRRQARALTHGARVNGMTRSTRTAFLLLLVLGWIVPGVVGPDRRRGSRRRDRRDGRPHRGSGGHADRRARGEDHGHDQPGRPLPGGHREPWQDDVDRRGGGLRALDPHGHGDRRGQHDDRRQAAGRDQRHVSMCDGGLVGVSLDSEQNLSGIRLSGKALEALPDDPQSLLQALRLLAATTGTRPDLVIVLRRRPAADAAAAAQGRHPERADQCESVFRRVRRAGSEPRGDPDQAGVRALSRQRTDRFQRRAVEQAGSLRAKPGELPDPHLSRATSADRSCATAGACSPMAAAGNRTTTWW